MYILIAMYSYLYIFFLLQYNVKCNNMPGNNVTEQFVVLTTSYMEFLLTQNTFMYCTYFQALPFSPDTHLTLAFWDILYLSCTCTIVPQALSGRCYTWNNSFFHDHVLLKKQPCYIYHKHQNWKIRIPMHYSQITFLRLILQSKK